MVGGGWVGGWSRVILVLSLRLKLNNILREDLKAFKQKKVNLGKGAKKLEAKRGDLVLIKNTDNEKQGIYGVIYEIEDNSTATTGCPKKKGD